MAASLTVQTLLERHANGIHQHQPIPTFAEIGAAGKLPHIAIVTCADTRCNPEDFLHLNTGEVIIFRNPGGSTMSALPGLLAIDSLVTLEDIIVVKHTDCGATIFRDDAIRDTIKQRVPNRAVEVDAMTFGNITTSLEDSVRENLRFLKGSDLVRKELADRCVGFVFDIKNGALTPVE
ncbi:carbonic anhydrase [Mytilinidion resinicola]|uniref:Carbonic anhydrase n=1 Tax=Mytilinidion resinicola TaxID=574789 RepID=A0A6A6YF19_9PEZI|nr:carbonic anhydrase [Mytilinidion resinicola]KAF2807426.1 carbonic anhydrase [Mytilinidion resinicola]